MSLTSPALAGRFFTTSAGSGLPIKSTEHCLELSAQGLVPLRWDCAREPKGTGEGPKPHAHDSALELSSGDTELKDRMGLGTEWL